MENLLGFKLDYHYYVLKNYKDLLMQHIDPRFITKLFSDLSIIGFYTSWHDIDSLKCNSLDVFDIDIPLQSFEREDLAQFINDFYINFNNSSNIIGENIDTEFNRIILPPLILSISNEIKYIGVSVKFYRRSEFIIEVFQNIDNSTPSTNYESFIYSNLKIYKPIKKADKELLYVESEFNNIDESIYEYLSIIEFNIFKVLKTSFFNKHFSILYFDNKMFKLKFDSNLIAQFVNAPYIEELGNSFHKTTINIQHYHYDIFSQKKILAATINKSKYNISESEYKNNRLKYTATNISYLLSALIPIHNKIFINELKLLRADKWYFKSLRDINLFSQFLNNINYNYTNLYTSNNYSINELYSKLKSSVLDKIPQTEIDHIFENMKINSINEKTNSTYLYINLISLLTFIITCFSIIQVLDIFNINNNFMVALPIIIILLIWLSWRFYKYSKFIKMMNNLNKFGIERPPLIVKLYNFMFFN
ncbi:hypothetical protein ACLIJU_11725 [Staphylococcus warneri]|uniref:hypothetical protein n=1 Tax=Staphylococcus warneri TaxID=1292 RepID=UPI000E69C9AC|nr:hypothetical protein [Staphylococcus warneri]RIN17961.1 hypothetical protein BU091_07625 [Staphylococcus warneri]